ncbi:MAG: RNA polymerase subunit sigma [Clostridia bacterium]|nr:RNA polymerase subunit sigma [Clostridia bacterium]
MNINERAMSAKEQKDIREELIKEYQNYIISVCSKTAGGFVPASSDTASAGMLAFNEAIDKYDISKGNFFVFAAQIIKNRVIDHLRAESRYNNTIPFSALSGKNDSGEDVPFDVEDTGAAVTDSALEITLLKDELSEYGISFFDLPDFSPKSYKTKRHCQDVIRYIISSPVLINFIKEKKALPIKLILGKVTVPEKVLERHRKYIIAAVVILDGDYENLSGYLSFAKGGAED